jgi:hypothetical protein
MSVGKRRLIVGTGLAMLALMLVCAGVNTWQGLKRAEYYPLADDVARRLHPGMTRSETEQAVGAYAKRYRCTYSDLYLFGSSDHTVAGMLALWFDRHADQDVLRSISGLDIDQINLFTDCAASGRAQPVAPGIGKGVRS